MKLRNKILAMAVVAVAGVNVYLANDVMDLQKNFSLLTLENIAEAQESDPGDSGDSGCPGPGCHKIHAEAALWSVTREYRDYVHGYTIQDLYCQAHTFNRRECKRGETKTVTINH